MNSNFSLTAIIVVTAGMMVLFLLIPLGTLLWRAGWTADTFYNTTVLSALWLSMMTASITTVIAVIIGTPVAYMLARSESWGVKVLDVLIDVPIVLPPAVAGIALLMTFGRNGTVGSLFGWQLPFTTAAVIVAQTFVATPLYIRAAKTGFAEVSRRLEQISATLGESAFGTFRRVTLPLARRALLGGAILTWARALGEFGATILFAGNLPGRTQTMPLAIYAALQTDLQVALTLAALLMLTSFGVLALLRGVTR